MKYLVISLFCSFISFAQSNDSIDLKKAKNINRFYNSLDSLVVLKPNFDYKFNSKDFNQISIYDRNTKLNDIYFYSKDSLYYVRSENINANQFMYRDSFNPNGVNNLGVGLIMGSINTVFKSIIK